LLTGWSILLINPSSEVKGLDKIFVKENKIILLHNGWNMKPFVAGFFVPLHLQWSF
jgi:hypothetical protein